MISLFHTFYFIYFYSMSNLINISKILFELYHNIQYYNKITKYYLN